MTKQQWQQKATAFLLDYIKTNPTFMADELRAAARDAAVPPAHDERAWGGVMNRASRAGVIHHVEYRKLGPQAHGRPASLWGAGASNTPQSRLF